jgi:hypothetical protein
MYQHQSAVATDAAVLGVVEEDTRPGLVELLLLVYAVIGIKTSHTRLLAICLLWVWLILLLLLMWLMAIALLILRALAVM